MGSGSSYSVKYPASWINVQRYRFLYPTYFRIEEDLMECFWDIRDGSSMYSEVNRLDTFPNQEDEIWKNLAEFGCHLVRGNNDCLIL